MHLNEDGYEITGDWQSFRTLTGAARETDYLVQNQGQETIEYFDKATANAPGVNVRGSTFNPGEQREKIFTVKAGEEIYMRTANRKSTVTITVVEA